METNKVWKNCSKENMLQPALNGMINSIEHSTFLHHYFHFNKAGSLSIVYQKWHTATMSTVLACSITCTFKYRHFHRYGLNELSRGWYGGQIGNTRKTACMDVTWHRQVLHHGINHFAYVDDTYWQGTIGSHLSTMLVHLTLTLGTFC